MLHVEESKMSFELQFNTFEVPDQNGYGLLGSFIRRAEQIFVNSK